MKSGGILKFVMLNGDHEGEAFKKLQLQGQDRGRRPTSTRPWVANQTGFKVKVKVKVKVVGSPPTRAQRVLNETLWNPAFF
jgi:hypothetical protein